MLIWDFFDFNFTSTNKVGRKRERRREKSDTVVLKVKRQNKERKGCRLRKTKVTDGGADGI